ncbi:MAG: ribose-phosphate pyrophosphokinase [Butyrivibrio sp.]|nr:ribose-phosphate pyrophosphokinase [Butyrivibrio sp.]
MYEKLGLIALESASAMGNKVNKILRDWRGEDFLIPCQCPRFSSGEAKGILGESVRDKDIYIIVDVCNNSLTYKMDGSLNRMSPDDHYQDLKRIIAACNGKASRITVIMPFLYESRQHRKTARESLDCAVMLKEMEFMGVHDLVTFDAHDPRMQNVLPINGFENISPSLQFTQALLTEYDDIIIDSDHLMFIAPDEGATERVVFLASVFGVNIGMFYKRRDYTRIVDGTNPIISHEFCGGSIEGMDVVVVDDMIASGGSMIDVCKQLKDRGAKRIFIFSTFGLFLNGFDKFDKAYEREEFTRIFTTNLIYQKAELLQKEYYFSVNMGRYIAAIIDTMNKGNSMQNISKPAMRIRDTVANYRK